MQVSAAADQSSTARTDALSLRQLRFVIALADTASFSRAAERTAVTQPALSAAIRQVETLLGVRLFDRTTHKVTPTEAGRAMLPHARRLLVTADNAFTDMRDAARRQQAIVRIGSIPSAMPVVAAALAALGERERITIHVSDGKSDDLVERVRNGGLDAAVCVAARREESFTALRFMDDDMVLAVPAGHALARERQVTWAMLEPYEIVHFGGGSIGELVSAAMRQSRLTHSEKYRVDQVASLFGLVNAGLAIGVMPRLYTLGSTLDLISLVPLIRPVVRRRLVLYHRNALTSEYHEGALIAGRLGILLQKMRS